MSALTRRPVSHAQDSLEYTTNRARRKEAALALDVNMEGLEYLNLQGIGAIYTASNLTGEMAGTQESWDKFDKVYTEYLFGRVNRVTPEVTVYFFPHLVHHVAAYLNMNEKLAPLFAIMEKPRTWDDGHEGPAGSCALPGVRPEPRNWEIAQDVALRWITGTEGRLNPFYLGNGKRLEELAAEHLEDLASLWVLVPVPSPVDAHPILSTNRLSQKIADAGKLEIGQTGLIAGGQGRAAIASTRITWLGNIWGGLPNINGMHYALSDAITAIMVARLDAGATPPIHITPTELARHILQIPKRGRPTDGHIREVIDGVETLLSTHALVEWFDYDGNPKVEKGPLVMGKTALHKHRNGAVTEGWKVYDFPVLTEHAGSLHQARQVDALLTGLRTSELRQATVTRFVTSQVIQWGRNTTPGHHWKLSYDTITANLGEAGHTAYYKSIWKWAGHALDSLKARGFITSWDPYYVGRKRAGVQVRLPATKDRPPLTEHGTQTIKQIGSTKK